LTPILPVVQGQSIGAKTVQPLLILSGALYSMGIAVDEIIDVVEDHLDITLVTDRPGVKGAAVVGGKATEILDVDHYLVLGLAIQSQLGRADEAAKERTVAA
jgi:two-component system chemotaxis sensor kinase CheA